MNNLMPFIIVGITTGSVYGLVAVGLVLTYKTSNIFNFAHGSLAAFAAFVFYFLRQQHGVPWPIALVLVSVILGPLMGLLLETLGRAAGPASTEIKIVTTIGLILIVLSLGIIWFPGSTRRVDPFLPQGIIRVDSVAVSWTQIVTTAFASVVTITLYFYLRGTRPGMAMRGVVDNPDLLSRTGENPARIRRYAWMIGCTLAAVSGVLLAPSIDLDASALTMLVIQAFGAAAIGGFSSLPLTFVGGIGLGIAGSLATKYAATYHSVFLSGASSSLPFIILFVVLVLTPSRALMQRAVKPVVEVHRHWHAPARFRLLAGFIALVFLTSVPSFAGVRLVAYSNWLITTIIILSLGLLVRHSKQVSLCQLAFAAVGAATMGHLAGSFHVPWLLSLAVSTVIVIPVAALLAIPAIRLSGVFLALATLGFGIVVQETFYPLQILFGTSLLGVSVPRPGISIGPWHMGTDRGFYWLILLVLVVVIVVTQMITEGRLGRLLTALGDSPMVLETQGTTVSVTRLIVFCISAAMASLAGALTGSLFGFASSTQFDSFTSLTLFVVVIIIIMGSPWYAILAAAGITLGPAYIPASNFSVYLQLAFGVGAATYVFVARKPLGVPQRIRVLMEGWQGRREPTRPSAMPVSAGEISEPKWAQARRSVDNAGNQDGLVVEGLTVKFGGLLAVSDLGLRAPLGKITGLIGPNGAGKSTTFNACSGLVRVAGGQVCFLGQDITRMAPHQRASLGIGRTFQRAELLDSLTVIENVEIGTEARFAGGSPWTQMRASREQREQTRVLADEALSATSLRDVSAMQVGLLPTGIRRRVEVARVLAGGFKFILMDEPSSGLDAIETRQLGQMLQDLVSRREVGLLLVEHDMSLVQQVCDYVHVLDFGTKIFEGSVEEMQSSESVRAAYLGSDYAPISSEPKASSGVALGDEASSSRAPGG